MDDTGHYYVGRRNTAQCNVLNFDLYQGSEKITSFPHIANVGHNTFIIPTSVKPGKGYLFRISDSKNQDQVVYSKTFQVKRRISLLVKALPVVLLATLVYVATLGKKSPENIPDPIIP